MVAQVIGPGWWLAVLALSMAAPTTGIDLEAEKTAIRAADSEMSRATEGRDVAAFLAFVGDDATFVSGDGSRAAGRSGVGKSWERLFAPDGPTLAWSPTRTEVAASADLGYTVGSFEFKNKNQDGKLVRRTGEYVTVWKKHKDGAWKVFFDIGRATVPAGLEVNRKVLIQTTSKAGDYSFVLGSFEHPITDGEGKPTTRTGTYLTIQVKGADGTSSVVEDVAMPAFVRR